MLGSSVGPGLSTVTVFADLAVLLSVRLHAQCALERRLCAQFLAVRTDGDALVSNKSCERANGDELGLQLLNDCKQRRDD